MLGGLKVCIHKYSHAHRERERGREGERERERERRMGHLVEFLGGTILLLLSLALAPAAHLVRVQARQRGVSSSNFGQPLVAETGFARARIHTDTHTTCAHIHTDIRPHTYTTCARIHTDIRPHRHTIRARIHTDVRPHTLTDIRPRTHTLSGCRLAAFLR